MSKNLVNFGRSFSKRRARIIGTGITPLGRLGKTASDLMEDALKLSLKSADIELKELDALIAIPSLSHPRFMEAHHLGTRVGLLPHSGVLLRTIDTGGAGPITALLEAKRMILEEHVNVVGIVGGDSVLSMPNELFFERANLGCQNNENPLPSPVIPNGYDKYAQWQIKNFGLKRDQLAMCSVLMSNQAINHPYSMTKIPYTLNDVLSSKEIGSVTNFLECARRADGGAAVIVCSDLWYKRRNLNNNVNAICLSGGEASGPLYPPNNINDINQEMFSCEVAASLAYDESQLTPEYIDYFSLYDCFPVCLIRAIEAVGLTSKGNGGPYIESIYKDMLSNNNKINISKFPVNTHGGLLAFGAPWEVPAMYNIIEAVDQISNKCTNNRQIHDCKRALVYGNGGIFSHSSVAILAKPVQYIL